MGHKLSKSTASSSSGSVAHDKSKAETAEVELPANDHRNIGKEQDLFFFHEYSPGSAFWRPKGTHIYNKLVDFIKEQYRRRGFDEVITPSIYKMELLKKSGHAHHYANNIFQLDVDEEKYALKPMNCPGHCLMYKSRPVTHKEMPIRYADFGVLHRNEASGALSGLTRVRRFQQDDAHIFCHPDKVVDEIKGCLDFLDYCYVKVFGFTYSLLLSTRPASGSLGDNATWESAERQLKQALDDCGKEYELSPGDGAFYGPKIDITIRDALNRRQQCATIQLDFQLPKQFKLVYYEAEANKKPVPVRPVMIHRAVLGSVERMVAILAENFSGKWPFWLSPRQASVIVIHDASDEAINSYAKGVFSRLHDDGFEVEFREVSKKLLRNEIGRAQKERFNFVLVVGATEKSNGSVDIRSRENERFGEVKIDALVRKFRKFRDERVLKAETADVFWSA